MTLTLNNATTVLGSRLNKLLLAIGLDASAIDLNDPIAYAVRDLGYTVADATQVVNSDLSSIAAAEENQFLDVAEYRGLETAQNNLAVKATMAVGPRRQHYSDIAAILDKILVRKAKILEKQYGFGLTSITAGVIDLAFAEENETS